MLSVELGQGILFVELAKIVGGWLWRNDMIGNRSELEFGCLDRLVAETAKDRMESIVGGRVPIAWYGSLLVVLIAAEAIWHHAPSSFYT
jgi:hypothetical protein